MKWILVTATAFGLAAATPAFATDNASMDNSTSGSSSMNKADSGPHDNVHAMTQQKLRKALKDAGFKDIKVLDASYLIQARDDDGNTVFMAINPPSVTTGSANSDQTTGSATSSGQAAGNSESGSDGSESK